MPAKAGIQGSGRYACRSWTPAFAGVTNEQRTHLFELGR